jgi:hypothetical protein
MVKAGGRLAERAGMGAQKERNGARRQAGPVGILSLALLFCFLHAEPAHARRRHPPRRRAAHHSAGCVSNPPGRAHLTAHTTPAGGIDLNVVQSLVDDGERIAVSPSTRRYNGGQVVITSGYRSCTRNARTRGSAKNSAHLRGHAIDIRSRMGSPYSYAMAIQAAGLHRPGGFYNTCVAHVHLDTEHHGFSNECGGKGKYKRRRAPRRRHRRR